MTDRIYSGVLADAVTTGSLSPIASTKRMAPVGSATSSSASPSCGRP